MKKKFKIFEAIDIDDYKIRSSDNSDYDVENIDDEKPYVTNVDLRSTTEDQILATPKKGKIKGVITQKVDSKFDIPKRDPKKKFIQDQNMSPEEQEQLAQQQAQAQQMGTDQAGGMIDPNAMGGMGMDQSYEVNMPTNDEQIGRIFELKKIYERLLSLDSYLSFSADPILIKLRTFTSDAVDLFEVVISNIMKFQDKVDEIIVIYYKFLNLIYNVIKVYFKRRDEKDQNEEYN